MIYDLYTTIRIYMLVNYICTFVLGITWYKTKGKYEGIFLVLVDFILQSVGFTLASLQFSVTPIISVVLANTLMYVGSIFMLFGVAKFVNVKIKKYPFVLLSALFVVLYSIYTLYMPVTNTRLIIFTFMIIPIFICVIVVALFKSDVNHRKFAFHVAIAHMLFVINHGFRGYNGISNIKSMAYEQIIQQESVLIITSLLLMIYLTFAVIQMIDMKLLYELDESVEYTKSLLSKSQYLAYTDRLTDIPNRRKVEEALDNEIDIYKKFGRVFSVLMIDIDDFKRFNDLYGHDFGDYILMEVAKCLRQDLRTQDVIGRWGGEEFFVVLPDTNLENAKVVGEKLIKKISSANYDHNDVNEKVTISIGCSDVKESDTKNTIIKNSDVALYNAKENGKNRMEVI